MTTPPRLDRDAALEALQTQVDDLTEICEYQQRQLDAQSKLIGQLAARAGMPSDTAVES
ncbi:hypothetical protein OHQ88_33390 (plasmid) [Micromonospora zamorensis]|uniref:hypothetical protein n=1 Tax=Micromonospora zamorensis TaxID=709883 RepID=UPI002E1DE793